MALRTTKATLHPSIAKRFKELDRVLSTVAALRASKSTGQVLPPIQPQLKGLCSELFAACAAVPQASQHQLLAHRYRTPYAELDLLIDQGDSLQIIEVKSCGQHVLLEGRVSMRQRDRLLAARTWIEGHHRRLTRLDLALVGPAGDVSWIYDFLS